MSATASGKGWHLLSGNDLVRDLPSDMTQILDSIAAYLEPSGAIDIAPQGNWTGGAMQRVRAGQVVNVFGSLKRTNSALATGGYESPAVYTLPAGWRPLIGVNGACESPWGPGIGFTVGTNGDIKFRNNASGSLGTGNFINFQVSFICDRA